MKYLLLASLFLIGCGGGGSSLPETVTETVVEQVPIIERECEEPETIYIYVEQNVTEPEPEIVTYYQQVTRTLNGEDILIKTYSDDGLTLNIYYAPSERLTTFTYDDNNNRLSEVIEESGVLISYKYVTYDSNSNILTEVLSNGLETVSVYDELGRKVRYEITRSGGEFDILIFTYGENTKETKYLTRDRIEKEIYDDNDNLISKEVIIDGNSTIETYTWQEFTEVVK